MHSLLVRPIYLLDADWLTDSQSAAGLLTVLTDALFACSVKTFEIFIRCYRQVNNVRPR